jgi:hypothetical protein
MRLHFAYVRTLDGWKDAPVELVAALLQDDMVRVNGEEDVFVALALWLAAQAPSHSAEVTARLLAHVRLALLPASVVQQSVLFALLNNAPFIDVRLAGALVR